MPHLNKNIVQFATIYNHMGNSLPDIAWFVVSKPLEVAKIILTAQKIKYLLQLFAPLCFFPLLDTHILVTCLLFFQHLLSSRTPEYMIEYHYDAEMLPFIFVSTVYGIKRFLNMQVVKKHLRPELISAFFLTVCITSAVSFGPFIEIAFNKYKTNRDVWDFQKERFLEMIPDKASIVATFEFLPELSQRKKLYSFHHVVHGFYTLSKKPYHLPQGIEYALLDVNDPIGMNAFYKRGRSEANIRKFFSSNNWGIVEILDNIVLLKNNHQSNQRFFQILQYIPNISVKLNAVVGDELVLLGYNIKKRTDIAGGSNIAVEFFWKALKVMKTDYRMLIEINDQSNKLKYQTIRPLCYRIFPTYMWGENSIIKENYFLFIPDNMKEIKHTVNIRLLDAKTEEVVPIYSGNITDMSEPVKKLAILKN